jgi:hypothetical protein
VERVIRATPLDHFRIEVEFSDGLKGVVDLSERLFGSMFAPLRDPVFFDQLRVDEFGAICWPNGADLAPDALYKTISMLQAG